MVGSTKRPKTSGSPNTVPTDAALGNVFNHFAIQWLGRVLKHCYLVLWQVASNAIMRDRRVSTESTLIRKGIARLKRTGADVVLLDPQYTTAVLAKAVAVPMVDLISLEARRQHIGTFHRFELMKDWHEQQRIPFETFSDADGLHMNDWGYDCFARNLEAAIIESAMPRAMASASSTDRSYRR